MAQSSNTVKFVYIPAGGSLPSQRDSDTIYFCVDDKKLYVGADLIADSVDISITGSGNYISDAVFSDGALTLTKSTLPDVSGAMRFLGISSTEITDQGVEIPTIDGEPVTPESGDVVLYEGLEFVWDGSKWNQLGDESSYALKTLTVTAGDGLTGGGTLTSDLTLTHYTPVSATTQYGYDTTLIQRIDVDDFGHIVSAYASDISEAIYSYISSFASEGYVADAVSGLISSSDVPGIIGSMGLVDSQYVSDAISNLVSSGYVSDVVSTAIADLASIEYVTGAITSATSTLTSKTYVDNAISSAVSGLASEEYVDNAVSGLASEGYVDDAIYSNIPNQTCDYLAWVESAGTHYYTYGSFGEVTSDGSDPVTGSTVYFAISSLASEGYVDDAVSGLASEDYVQNAISSATSSFITGVDIESTDGSNTGKYLCGLTEGTDETVVQGLYRNFGSIADGVDDPVAGSTVYNAISNFVSADYVSSAISNAISAIYSEVLLQSNINMTSAIGPYDLSHYIYNVNRGSNNNGIYVNYAPYGSILSDNNQLVTGGIVYSAISNLVSADYVSNAISSATSGLLSQTHVSMYSEDNHYSNRFLYYANGGSTDTAVNLYYASFGSIGESDPYPVTGSTVYDALSRLSIPTITVESAALSQQYLYSVVGTSDLTYSVTYSSFGSVVNGNNNLVTGGIVHDAIIDHIYGSNFVTSSVLSTWSYGDGTFLTGIHLPSNAGIDPYELYYAPIGQVTSTEEFFVPGSAIYSAIQSAVPTWTVI